MGIIKAIINRKNPNCCNYCGNKLTDKEKTYYVSNCEKCEAKIWEKLDKEDEDR